MIGKAPRPELVESMVAVTPKANCPHVQSSVTVTPDNLATLIRTSSAKCSQCPHEEENWICLTCNSINCGRFAQQHASQHNQKSRHHIALGYADLSVWCYTCDSYIISPVLQPLLKKASEVKFSPASSTTAAESGGNSGKKKKKSGSPAPSTSSSASSSTSSSSAEPSATPTPTYPRNAEVQAWLDEQAALYGYPKSCVGAFSQTNVTVIVSGKLPYEHASVVVLLCSDINAKFAKYSFVWQVVWESFNEFKLRGAPSTTHNGVADMAEMELIEHSDNDFTLKRKAAFLAKLIRESKHCVLHTGAGISTNAQIADFRGPNGMWTRKDKGMAAPQSIPFTQATPTKTHMSIVKLVQDGLVKYVVSQNVDGLHRRSGLTPQNLSELHGNCYKEYCHKCKRDYLRRFDVGDERGPFYGQTPVGLFNSKSGHPHVTGRKCDVCPDGFLLDSIIHFGEDLPHDELERATEHSSKSDLSVCLGTSLRVSPACNLPNYTAKNSGIVIIVNKQATPKDDLALKSGGIVIHADIDQVFEHVMAILGKQIPPAV